MTTATQVVALAALKLKLRHNYQGGPDPGEAREGLMDFACFTYPGFLRAEHLQSLANHLEAVERRDITRLMIVLPPRHGKSELCSIRFPCWYLGRHPKDLVVQSGYAESIALTHSRRARDVFISPEMRRVFPDVHHRPERAGQEVIIPERQAAHEWGTKQGGSYYAVGIGGGLTGRGYDIGIIDDPLKDAEEADSLNIREKVWEWYTMVFYPRQQPNAAIIIVMTRWHQDDLVGRLQKQAKNDPAADQWTVLHMPAIDSEGNALWPARYPVEYLDSVKHSTSGEGAGSRAFEALYQGNPSAAEGNIIKREWWRHYQERPMFLRTIHSWDTAFKDKAKNDFSVCTVWGEAQNGYYLLDVWRGKVEFPELKRVAEALCERDNPDAVLIEDKASGQSLVQELQRNTRIPVLAVKVDSNKVARVNAATPLIEAGKALLPESAPWLFDYIEELSGFPTAEHDDQVDSTTQALAWLRGPMEPEQTIVVYDSMRAVDLDLEL